MQERHLEQTVEQQHCHLQQLKQLQERLVSQLASQTTRSEQGLSDEELTGLLKTLNEEKTSPGVVRGYESRYAVGADPGKLPAAVDQPLSLAMTTPPESVRLPIQATPVLAQSDKNAGSQNCQTPAIPPKDPNATVQQPLEHNLLDQFHKPQWESLVISHNLPSPKASEGFCTPSTASAEFLQLPDLSSNAPYNAINRLLHQPLVHCSQWPQFQEVAGHAHPDAHVDPPDDLSIQSCTTQETSAVVENQTRAALVEKHRKHVEDLQSYYESQIAVLKGQLSSFHPQMPARSARSPVAVGATLTSSPIKSRAGHPPASPLSSKWEKSSSLRIQRLLAENGQLLARCMELENQLDEQYK